MYCHVVFPVNWVRERQRIAGIKQDPPPLPKFLIIEKRCSAVKRPHGRRDDTVSTILCPLTPSPATLFAPSSSPRSLVNLYCLVHRCNCVSSVPYCSRRVIVLPFVFEFPFVSPTLVMLVPRKLLYLAQLTCVVDEEWNWIDRLYLFKFYGCEDWNIESYIQ